MFLVFGGGVAPYGPQTSAQLRRGHPRTGGEEEAEGSGEMGHPRRRAGPGDGEVAALQASVWAKRRDQVEIG